MLKEILALERVTSNANIVLAVQFLHLVVELSSIEIENAT